MAALIATPGENVSMLIDQVFELQTLQIESLLRNDITTVEATENLSILFTMIIFSNKY